MSTQKWSLWEFMGVGKESDDEDEEYIYEGANGLQESYYSLLEKTREYARVAKVAIRRMKKAEQDYKRIFKLMLKWSGLLQRNLMRCLFIKSPLPIEDVWDTLMKVAQVPMCLRR